MATPSKSKSLKTVEQRIQIALKVLLRDTGATFNFNQLRSTNASAKVLFTRTKQILDLMGVEYDHPYGFCLRVVTQRELAKRASLEADLALYTMGMNFTKKLGLAATGRQAGKSTMQTICYGTSVSKVSLTVIDDLYEDTHGRFSQD